LLNSGLIDTVRRIDAANYHDNRGNLAKKFYYQLIIIKQH